MYICVFSGDLTLLPGLSSTFATRIGDLEAGPRKRTVPDVCCMSIFVERSPAVPIRRTKSEKRASAS